MANKSKETIKPTAYTSVAVVNSIQATSRISLKCGDTFYTLEYTEERIIPSNEYLPDLDLDEERRLLWDKVNSEVDKQAEEVQNLYKK